MRGDCKFSTSIGKKQVVAVTGLLLCGFLVSHLAGNLLMLKSGQAFDHYAEFLEEHPLLIPAELGLAFVFLAHIFVGLRLAWQNRAARPERYEVTACAGGRTPGSSTMKYTGLFTLVFLMAHIYTFKIQHPEDTSLFAWVMGWFHYLSYTAFYVLAMLSLGLHLSHGVWSSFQTLGVNNPRYSPYIRFGGVAFAALMAVGFGMLPVWAHFLRGG
ncbi:MAG TPA: succinate dehydrogenase cytochrome b subunit [Elusimicrobiota bacterium]|jgi:succinate dehydrogenase / fumarate reductase cytochrome b subunit|nr:succinate dehydrogenase cytochrome b subunit [Elusimicrobiota bacterium]